VAAPPYRFTTYDLDGSLEVARVLKERGNGLASADELAIWLGYSKAKNGAFLARLANARLFGLVDGQSSELRLTQRALDILQPDYPTTAARARLEAFEQVPLYKAVLDHYHGQVLPDETGMKNALESRWKINADKSTHVLTRLLDSAEQAGLFKVAGNRSKMVRPTFGRDGEPSKPRVDGEVSVARVHQGNVFQANRGGDLGDGAGAPAGARDHKLIDGALDLLPPPPPAGEWSEAGLKQWIAFIESALRVVYQLPAKGGDS
jgi:hypothetical protein